MVFNSYIFVLAFLPIAILGYFGLNRMKSNAFAKAFLVVMSFVFYAYYNPKYLFLFCISIISNWTISQLIKLNSNHKKLFLVLGVLFNIMIIFYFKYYNFFIDNINKAFNITWNTRNIVLPLGISFYTFQQISYIVDIYKGEHKGDNLLDYALYVSFFPQLVAGPIAFRDEIICSFNDENNRRLNQSNISEGLYFFTVGLFKKVIFADMLGQAVNWGYDDVASLSTAEALIVSLSYTFQIYFDFSGYSDMAVGLGRFFNIKLPNNFNSPYKADSIIDFWRRWHITLTRFLRKYVYFSLGGNEKGSIRKYINIFIVFVISGIWHGAGWTFIIWGMLHGILNILNRVFDKVWNKINHWVRVIATFGVINVLWCIFRAETITDAVTIIKKLFIPQGLEVRNELFKYFYVAEIDVLEEYNDTIKMFLDRFNFLPMIAVFSIILVIVWGKKNVQECNIKLNYKSAIFIALLLFYSIISFSKESIFIYFNF